MYTSLKPMHMYFSLFTPSTECHSFLMLCVIDSSYIPSNSVSFALLYVLVVLCILVVVKYILLKHILYIKNGMA